MSPRDLLRFRHRGSPFSRGPECSGEPLQHPRCNAERCRTRATGERRVQKDALFGPGAPFLRRMPAARGPTVLDALGKTADGRSIWKMPILRGLTPREAIQLLEGHPFHLEVQGSGFVRSQTPEEGKPVTDGDTIRLTLFETP